MCVHWYRYIMLGIGISTLSACGHYGPLYPPSQAAAHEHHPTPTPLPKNYESAKSTIEYGDFDSLTITDSVQGQEALHGY